MGTQPVLTLAFDPDAAIHLLLAAAGRSDQTLGDGSLDYLATTVLVALEFATRGRFLPGLAEKPDGRGFEARWVPAPASPVGRNGRPIVPRRRWRNRCPRRGRCWDATQRRWSCSPPKTSAYTRQKQGICRRHTPPARRSRTGRLRYSPCMTARTRRPAIGLDASAQLEAVREVLRAISRAPFDLEGVLGIVVERAASLCSADLGMVFVPAGEGFYRGAAAWGMKPEHAAYEMEHQTPITQGTVVGRVVLSGDAVQVEDSAADPMYTWKEGRSIGGYRSIMGVPIRTGEQLIGVVNLARNEVRRFSADEIELVRTFADQAAIVLDNVRLLSTIERQREELARYLPSTVVELLSSAEGEQLLAGHRREVSAVFCDLRGFTSFAESAEPEEVLDVLREYHREMGALVLDHGGTVEHFAGDGMMIFLNDPTPVPDHPAEAVRMALEMRDRFGGLTERWRRLGFELGLGLGISVGYATLGRIGFEGHFGYAVIGSVANLAARLCAIAEPGQIVLSERAYTRVELLVEATALGPMEFKGFRRPVEAYAVSALRPGS